jgi:hypothetical protein
MEYYIRELCKFYGWSFDKVIQQYNSNKMTNSYCINCIIDYKIKNNKDNIHKEDIPKMCSIYYKHNISQEEFMKNVISDIKYYNLDINNLTIKRGSRNIYLLFYYISTFLEHEPVDIKIALKD